MRKLDLSDRRQTWRSLMIKSYISMLYISVVNHCCYIILPHYKLTVWLYKTRNYIFINTVWPNVFTWHSPPDCENVAQPCLSLQDNKVSIEPDTATRQKYWRCWENSVFWFIIELNVQQVHISCNTVSESERSKIKIINVLRGYRKIMVKQKRSGTK